MFNCATYPSVKQIRNNFSKLNNDQSTSTLQMNILWTLFFSNFICKYFNFDHNCVLQHFILFFLNQDETETGINSSDGSSCSSHADFTLAKSPSDGTRIEQTINCRQLIEGRACGLSANKKEGNIVDIDWWYFWIFDGLSFWRFLDSMCSLLECFFSFTAGSHLTNFSCRVAWLTPSNWATYFTTKIMKR